MSPGWGVPNEGTRFAAGCIVATIISFMFGLTVVCLWAIAKAIA